jgi:hypothetical protein
MVNPYSIRSLSGHEYFIDGKFSFTESPIVPEVHGCHHQTVFGYAVAHNGVIYDNSARSLNRAGTRLSVVRSTLWYDDYLRAKQVKFLDQISSDPDDLLTSYLKARFSAALVNWSTMLDYALEHVHDPHPKKDLRIQALQEVLDEGRSAGIVWSEQHRVAYKIKKAETAKAGKVPRCIGDLGVPSSLQGAFITKLMKNALEETPFQGINSTSRFCAKPSPRSLGKIFDIMQDPPCKYDFVYFSDDSCLTWMSDEGLLWANLDIAKCDASHTSQLFEYLYYCTPAHAKPAMRSLIQQCSGPIVVKNPNKKGHPNYKKETLVIQPVEKDGKTPRATLLSGSTLTTLINNVANLLIGHAISLSGATTKKDIEMAANATGYVVTVEMAHHFEQVQFLKHSPAMDTKGVYRPLLNLGVALRLSGRCHRDLPAAKGHTLQRRAEDFQKALLSGALPRVNHPMASAMRTAADLPPIMDEQRTAPSTTLGFGHSYLHEDDSPLHEFDNSIFKRYNLSTSQIDELLFLLSRSKYGYMYSCSGADEILRLDYGLRCPDRALASTN